MLINLRNGMMGGKKRPPWDYRVAYLQVVSGIPKFVIPTPPYWNSLVPEGNLLDLTTNVEASLIVSAPGTAASGDRKFFGNPVTFGMGRYQSKWRPCGMNDWIPQPTSAQIPFVADAPVKMMLTPPNKCTILGPSGEVYETTYNANYFATNSAIGFGYWETSSSALRDTRIYEASLVVSDTTYGFKWRFVPCIKNNTLYICDIYSGLLVGNTGSGTASAGPQVPDDYNGYPY